MKASDYSCVPLCPECHTQGPKRYHQAGGKRAMERRIGARFEDVSERLRAEYTNR